MYPPSGLVVTLTITPKSAICNQPLLVIGFLDLLENYRPEPMILKAPDHLTPSAAKRPYGELVCFGTWQASRIG
jgi:hypothetical protein